MLNQCKPIQMIRHMQRAINLSLMHIRQSLLHLRRREKFYVLDAERLKDVGLEILV